MRGNAQFANECLWRKLKFFTHTRTNLLGYAILPNRKGCRFCPRVGNGANHLLILVINVIRVIEIHLVQILQQSLAREGDAVRIADLHCDHQLAADVNSIKRGNVTACHFGFIDRHGRAPRISFAEDTLNGGSRNGLAVFLPGQDLCVQNCIKLLVGIVQSNVAVIEHGGYVGQIPLLLVSMQSLGCRFGAVIQNRAVLHLNRVCKTDFRCRTDRKILDLHQRAVASVRKISVAIHNVIDIVTIHGEIDHGGKSLLKNGALPSRTIPIICVDGVCGGFIYVQFVACFIIIVVGRNAEDVIVAVLRPSKRGLAVDHTDLMRILVRAVDSTVDHGLYVGGRRSGCDRLHLRCGKCNPLQ